MFLHSVSVDVMAQHSTMYKSTGLLVNLQMRGCSVDASNNYSAMLNCLLSDEKWLQAPRADISSRVVAWFSVLFLHSPPMPALSSQHSLM